MRQASVFFLVVAAIDILAGPARAQGEPIVEPISVRATAQIPKPQASDDEAPDPRTRRTLRAPEAFDPNGRTSAEPETSQLVLGVVVGVLSLVAAIKAGAATTGNRQLWYAGAVLAGGAVGTGLIVCALGQTSATRHGGCRASVAGALIGAVAVLPGILLIKYEASQPCTATGPNDDDKCVTDAAVDGLLGLLVAGGGYVLGTACGARLGWELGATARPVAPGTAAGVSLLSMSF